MTLKASFAIAAVLLILTVAPAGSQTVTPIEFPGAAHTRPHGINSSGEISGIYVNPDNSVHSFLLDRKGFTTIDVPGAIGTNALRINPQGEIVGFYIASSGAGSGFLWRRGTFSDIVLPGTVLVTGNGINARGDVVGQYNDTPGIPQHGYVLNHKGFVAIDVPGAVRSTAFDINERGDIVGAYVGADGMTRLYLLSSGVFTTIDVPGALGTLGTGRRAHLPGSMRGVTLSAPIEGLTARLVALFGIQTASEQLTLPTRCSRVQQPSTLKGTSWASIAILPVRTTAFCFGTERALRLWIEERTYVGSNQSPSVSRQLRQLPIGPMPSPSSRPPARRASGKSRCMQAVCGSASPPKPRR